MRTSTPPNLEYLPIDVLVSIFSQLSTWDKLHLRKVSRGLRSVMDDVPTGFKSIHLFTEKDTSTLTLHDGTTFPRPLWVSNNTPEEKKYNKIVYWGNIPNYGLCEVRGPIPKNERWTPTNYKKRVFSGTHQHELVIGDMMTAVGMSSKDVFQNLTIECHHNCGRLPKFLNEVESKLRLLGGHIIRVEQVKIASSKPDLENLLLPYLMPGVLKELEIEMKEYEVSQDRVSKIMETEQWKKSKSRKLTIHAEKEFPIETFLNCPSFTLNFVSEKLTDGFFIKLITTIISSPFIESVRILTSSRDNAPMLRRHFGPHDRRRYLWTLDRFSVKVSDSEIMIERLN